MNNGRVAPKLRLANRGIGVEAKIALSSGERNWTEEVRVVHLAAEAFRREGHVVAVEETWLRHVETEFAISPQLVAMTPLNDGGVQTATTIQVNHPTLTPDGVFEYQHSTGNSVADSVAKGFDQWLRTDFPPLLDALRPAPTVCAAMEMSFPVAAGVTRCRRAVFGPITHFMQHPPAEPSTANEDHPFCPCCLLTKSFEAFRDLIEGEGFHGVRLFAARDEHGEPQADCRVDGEDWEKGAEALREYARTWPAAGHEFRKQYVVLRNISKLSRQS